MKRSPISDHEFTQGFMAGLPALNRGLENSYAEGSRNLVVQGDGFTLPWQGLAGQGDDTGTRLMRQILSTWGGLKDRFVGSTHIEGRGSMFSDIGKSMWYIGVGIPSIEGAALAPGVFASTELQVSIARNGLYSAAFTYDAGLPQPSTPDIGIISTPGFGFTGFIDGPVSCKIARLRLTTGARSVSSPTSAVIKPAKKTVRVTFPLPSQGQDFWAVFFTQSGFGGVGLHYRAAYQDSLDIAESIVTAGIIDGIPRSLEFDFKDGDLVPEVAYIDDYPPPAGTHAVRLANVMCVLGAYGDSTAPVTSSDPGTVGAISLPNFYESYKPRNLVFFPEQIVDVLARPTDEYAYVGHRNSITALQYVGVLDGPAVAVSMVWPDIGIYKPHNWCQVHGLLYLFQAKGGPVRMMPDGSPDYSFAAPVRRYMRDWTVEETIVGSHPDSLSVVYFNGREALSWSLQAQKWSPPCFFEDVCVEDSPIPSSSPSASISPSASFSASISASPSRSPSASPSASPSSSGSSSPSSSPSVSPSASLSASPSVSVSASPSASPSGSVSSSPSSSLSASPSASSSSSPSASPSASPSSSPSAPDLPLSGLILQLEADSLSQGDNTDVDPSWTDISPSANHALKGSGSNAKYRSAIDGLPAIQLDGVDDFFDLTSSIADGEWSFLAVYQPTGAVTNKAFFGASSGTNHAALRVAAASNFVSFFRSGIIVIDSTVTGVTSDDWNLLTVIRRSDGTGTFRTNGANNGGWTGAGTYGAIQRIGACFNGAVNDDFFKIYFRALIMYDHALDGSEIADAEGFLNNKYTVF